MPDNPIVSESITPSGPALPDRDFCTRCEGGGIFVEDLDSPYVNNAVQPVVYADSGLGIRHIENKLFINFERWFNLKAGDVFEFFMGNERFPLAWDEIRPGEDNQLRYQLAISRELVPLGFVYPCFGRVLRVGSNNESTSPKQTWFVKDTRPRGVDQDPGLPYHSELKVSLPPDLSAPGAVLDPERALHGVVLTIFRYPEIRVRDTIELYWNGHLVLMRLDDDHVSGARPIEILVEPEIIFRPHGSGLLTIRIRVQDEVLNYSGELQQWSQAVHLESDLDPSLLERPYFLVDGYDITDVDFDTQGDGHFEVEVYVPNRLPDGSLTPTGTQIVVTLNGTRHDGSPLVVQLPPFPARINRSAFTDVDNDLIKQLINGTLQISYELQFPLGTVLGSSRRLTVTVFGVVSTMPAVNVVEDDAGLIDPTLDYITVEFPEYTPYDRNYNVTLRLEALRPGGGVEFYEQTLLAGAPPPPTRFRIVPRTEFQRFVGLGDARLFYRVDDGVIGVLGGIGALAIRESEHLVVKFGERVAEMPAPLLQGVDEHDNLDPADVIGIAIVTLPYLRTAPDDTFIWRWVGSGVGGSTGDEIILNGGTAGRPVEFPVDKVYVDLNNNGELRLSYTLIPGNGGPALRSEVLVVSVGPALGDLIRPEVLEASRHPDQLTPEAATAGATIWVSFHQMRPTDRVRACWSGIPGVGSHCETKDGNSHQTLEFNVPATVVGANIHPDGRHITVQYFLIRGARETPSEVLTLQLLALTTLPIPTIEGIGDSPVLDLSRLVGYERTTINRWPFIHRLQRMWMEYEGTYADGSLYFEATYTNNLVTADGEVDGIMPPTPVDELRHLRDGSQLTIRFWVSFDRGTDRSTALLFRVREYQVQALPGVLPHPFIAGASGTGPSVTVEPLSIENNVRVSVRYDGMLNTDKISLEWIYQDASIHSATLDGLEGGTVVFTFDNAILARSVNSTIVLRYTLLRNGNTVPSEDQTVRINTIAAASLPRPLINGIANAGLLDLNTFNGNAQAAVAKWRLSTSGQRVWLTCKRTSGSELAVLNGVAITASEALNGLANKAVLRSWLQALPNNSQFTVECSVTFDGGSDRARAVSFPVTTYTVAQALQIDASVMYLNGYAIIAFNWPRNGQDYPGNALTRLATGGSPPYTYTSRNAAIAQVTSGGKVVGYSNGSTVIDVRDGVGHTVSYSVSVSNVWRVRENANSLTSTEAYNWRRSLPGAIGLDWTNGIEYMQRVYGPASQFPVPYDAYYWVCIDNGVYCFWLVDATWDTRQPAQISCLGVNWRAWAWCLQPT